MAGTGVSQWADAKQDIFTETEFRVESVERGAGIPDVVRIRTVGGELDGQGQFLDHEAHFQVNERSRVFLIPADDGTFRVAGGDFGKQQALPSAGDAPGDGVGVVTQALCGTGYCTETPSATYLWNKMPIPYYINSSIPAGHSAGSLSDIVTAVRNGYDAWEADKGSTMEWSYQGITTATSPIGPAWVVYWGPAGCAGDLTVACTDYVYVIHTDGTKEIQAAKTVLNQALCWRGDGGTGACSDGDVPLDVQHVMTHEAGHAIGLDHTPDSAEIMFASYQPRRTLGTGDIAGVRSLYPAGWSPWENLIGPSPVTRLDAATTNASAVAGKGNTTVVTNANGGYLSVVTRTPNTIWSTWSQIPNLTGQIPGAGPTLFSSEQSVPAGHFLEPLGKPVVGFQFYGASFLINPTTGATLNQGGPVGGPPSGLYTSNGGVDEVVQGTDKKLYYFGCTPSTTVGCTTKAWTKVNDTILGSDPKIIALSSTKALIVAASPSHDLLTLWLTSGTFGAWVADGRGANLGGAPSGAARGPHRIDLVARASNGTLKTVTYGDGVGNGLGWGPWTAVDGTVMSVDPAATSWSTDRFDIYSVRASDGAIVHIRQAN